MTAHELDTAVFGSDNMGKVERLEDPTILPSIQVRSDALSWLREVRTTSPPMSEIVC